MRRKTKELKTNSFRRLCCCSFTFDGRIKLARIPSCNIQLQSDEAHFTEWRTLPLTTVQIIINTVQNFVDIHIHYSCCVTICPKHLLPDIGSATPKHNAREDDFAYRVTSKFSVSYRREPAGTLAELLDILQTLYFHFHLSKKRWDLLFLL